MLISKSQTASSAGGVIPEQVYRVRCLGTQFKAQNSSGNPMTTLNCEIIDPESLEIDGVPVVVAGRKFTIFAVHNFEDSGWGTQEEVLEAMDKLGITLEDVDPETGEPAYDTAKGDEYFKGLEFDIILRSKEDVKRFTVGPNRGKPILDGEGKEISAGQRINARLSDIMDNCHPTRNEEVARRPY